MTEQSIKAIPTEYSGVHYRSRTEARWAILFDLLGIKFEYEKVKFQTGISNYIPDFVLPELRTIFEVKGTEPTRVELERLADLRIGERRDTERIITSGGPGSQLQSVYRYHHEVISFEHYLSQCCYCGKFGFFGKESEYPPTQMIPFGHYPECEESIKTALEFDITNDFYGGYSNGDRKPARVSPVSPLVVIAIKAASSISFDSRNFYETIELHREYLDVLKAHRVFCGSAFIHEMYRYILNCRKDEQCPRFYDGDREPAEGEVDERFFLCRYRDLEKRRADSLDAETTPEPVEEQ